MMLKKFVWSIHIVLVIVLLLSYLAPYIDPSTISWLSITGLLYPILYLLNVCFVLYWILKGDRKFFLGLLVAFLGLMFFNRYVGVSTSPKMPVDNSFTIATYNLKNASAGYDFDSKKRRSKRDKLEKFLDLLRPADIICVQEKGAFATDVINDVFNEHTIYSIKNKGAAIMSRFPIVHRGEIDFGTNTNSCLWADIEIGDDIVRVYSVHLQSNQISSDAKVVLDNVDLQKEQTWKGIGGIFQKFRSTHIRRSLQSVEVHNHIKKSPYPVLLGGDLNDTPMSYTYEVLTSDLQDSFIEKGKGLGTTYADRIPLLRIDYVLASENLQIHSHDVKPSRYSDHYPVLADISVR